MSAKVRDDQGPSLADPVSCGEDHAYNLRKAAELARQHCGACADYHVWTPATRLAGRKRSTDSDRQRFASFLAGEFWQAADAGRTVDVVIAGAGDTGILATTAHAAYIAGGGFRERCRYSVLDLCLTPVLLCKEFGARHGLSVEGEATDITQPGGEGLADFVILHGVLRFIGREMHETVLRRMAERLRSGGRIIVSNRLNPDPDSGLRSSGMGEAVLEMIADGRIESPEPPEEFTARIRRCMEIRRILPENELEDAAAARALFEKAGLRVLRFDSFEEPTHLSPGQESRMRARVHAVLDAPP